MESIMQAVSLNRPLRMGPPRLRLCSTYTGGSVGFSKIFWEGSCTRVQMFPKPDSDFRRRSSTSLGPERERSTTLFFVGAVKGKKAYRGGHLGGAEKRKVFRHGVGGEGGSGTMRAMIMRKKRLPGNQYYILLNIIIGGWRGGSL